MADPRVAAALWALRIVLYAGLFIGTGGSFFLAWFAPYGAVGRHRWVIALALVAGLAVTPVLVGLQGADALELPLTDLTGQAAWRTGLGTSFGMTAIGAALAMLAEPSPLRATCAVPPAGCPCSASPRRVSLWR